MIDDEIIVNTYLKPRKPSRKGQSNILDSYVKLDEFYKTLTNNQKFRLLEKIAQDFDLELDDHELRKEVSSTK